jgi:MacB-like periplasmic core domain
LQTLLMDLKFALRQVRKSLGFAVTAVLMLAFGIGATTAIFSIVEGVLLRPLPFPHSDRLVVLSDHLQGIKIASGGDEVGVTPCPTSSLTPAIRTPSPHLVDTRAQPLSSPVPANRRKSTPPASLPASFPPSASFPNLAATSPQTKTNITSRWLFSVTRHGATGSTPTRKVIGTKILLDRKPYIVIGVMPRGFEFPLIPGQLNRSELWVPMSFTPDELSPRSASNWSYQMIGRLKPAISPEQAQTDANRVARGDHGRVPR